MISVGLAVGLCCGANRDWYVLPLFMGSLWISLWWLLGIFRTCSGSFLSCCLITFVSGLFVWFVCLQVRQINR